MKEDRIQQMMKDLGQEQSTSLYQALHQIANETAQEYEQKFKEYKELRDNIEKETMNSLKNQAMLVLDSADEFTPVITKAVDIILKNGPAFTKLFDSFSEYYTHRTAKNVHILTNKYEFSTDQAIMLVVGSKENAHRAMQQMSTNFKK